MKKILFNANILSCYNDRNSNRSGIYVMACDLLSELYRQADLDIAFFCDRDSYENTSGYLTRFYPAAKLYTTSRGPLQSFLLKYLRPYKPRK